MMKLRVIAGIMFMSVVQQFMFNSWAYFSHLTAPFRAHLQLTDSVSMFFQKHTSSLAKIGSDMGWAKCCNNIPKTKHDSNVYTKGIY